MAETESPAKGRAWPDYAAIWRWHFYAGLFCLPFFCWLAVTGSVYLFRPDIEAWLDAPFEGLHFEGARAAPSREVQAAVAVVPGSVLSRYEPPATPTGAAQIVVAARDGRLMRVYVHPASLKAMRIVQDDHRPMELIAHLHGNLLLDQPGSMLVEVAGSWGIVMILTGFYLWLPRGKLRLAGVVYPRLDLQGRTFWRDLHSVTALWISVVTLFMLVSGLPWSASWGNYFIWARNHLTAPAAAPAWPVGGQVPAVADPASKNGMPGMTAAEMAEKAAAAVTAVPATVTPPERSPGIDVEALNRIVPVAARLDAPRPVWISPPAQGSRDWTVSSQTQNRPLRVTYTVSPDRGEVTDTKRFSDERTSDRVILLMIGAHEGQLFGRINQAILLVTAVSLIVVAVSAIVMWWRRRPNGKLGAPPAPPRRQLAASLVIVIATLSLFLPLFGLSLLLLVALDLALLAHLPGARSWLGLAPREG